MGNRNLLLDCESATKTVLEVAKVVLGLSSYVDGELLARSSGFLIDWDEKSEVGTILTSTRPICSKYSSLDQWLGTDKYLPNAMVCAYLLDKDETTLPALLLYYNKHLNIALFKIDMDSCTKISRSNSEVKNSQDIFVLGRDDDLNLIINYEHVQFKGSTQFERHYYMYIGCATDQVSFGSIIKKAGVRAIDIIKSINEECIATTVEVMNPLMKSALPQQLR